MKARKITVGDIQAVTEYSRDQLRGLLDQIDPVFGVVPMDSGLTRIFSAHEFLVIVLCCELETMYGLKRKMVASFAAEIAKALARPRPVGHEPKLILTFGPQKVQYLDGTEMVARGLVFPLADIFRRVDDYLLPHRHNSYQGDLNLGPSLMAQVDTSSQTKKAAGRRE